jgi:hypothetical protein
MEDQEPYEPDIDREAKQALQDERDRLASLELPTVTVRGQTYTECSVHGIRVNSEKYCSNCDFIRSPNCDICGKEKDNPFLSPMDEKLWSVKDAHAECRKESGGYWMHRTISEE